MANELTIKQDFTNDQLALIKATVAKGATNDELQLFLYRCKNMGLDPLRPGQVFFVKYGSNPGTVVVGLDGFRLRASKSGKHVGTKRGVLRDSQGNITHGWAEVYRADWTIPARAEVALSEYDTGKAQWATKKQTMIEKTAEVAALRMAFPDELGGLYAEEELGAVDTPAQTKARDIQAKLMAETAPQITATREVTHAPSFTEPVQGPGDDFDPGDYLIRVGTVTGKRVRELTSQEMERLISYKGTSELAVEAREMVLAFQGGEIK